MSVLTTDIKHYKSSNSNSTGGSITATEILDLSLHNLFDAVSADEAEDGAVEYRKFFVKNTSVDQWQNVVGWIQTQTLSDSDEIAIGLGTSDDNDGSIVLSPLTAQSVIAVISNLAGDTRTVTLIGEDVNGNRVTEVLTLNGTTQVVGSQSFAKLYNAAVSSVVGNADVTIKQGAGGTTLGILVRGGYSAITYLTLLSKEEGFKLGNISAGSSQGIWVRRTVNESAEPYSANQAVVNFEGETA